MLRTKTFYCYMCLLFNFILTYLLLQIYVIDSADKKRFEETGLVSLMHSCHFYMQTHSDKNHKNYLNVIKLTYMKAVVFFVFFKSVTHNRNCMCAGAVRAD